MNELVYSLGTTVYSINHRQHMLWRKIKPHGEWIINAFGDISSLRKQHPILAIYNTNCNFIVHILPYITDYASTKSYCEG